MSDTQGRAAIFGRIRQSLGRASLDAARSAELDARIAACPGHTRPAQRGAYFALFKRRFEARGGSVEHITDRDTLPAAVAAYLDNLSLPRRIVLAPSLTDLPWPADIERAVRRAYTDDLVAVSDCRIAVAETGSLLFTSGPASPTTHNFVPDHQLVLLDANSLVCHLEDAWGYLRTLPNGMPRAVNLVSGPSRTGDIEQTIQLGAHGPRRVHVLVINAA
ncbi:MAG: lactate utilization protein [Rhodocyclaceae bacterium]